MNSLNQMDDTDPDSDRIQTTDDLQNDDSIIQSDSLNTDEVVRNLVENTISDAAVQNDSIRYGISLDTDEIVPSVENGVSEEAPQNSLRTDDVRNLFENTFDEEAAQNCSIVHNNSLYTDDVVRNLAENNTDDTIIDSRDEILESMLESIMNDDEPPDSATLDDSQTSEIKDTTFASTDADISLHKPDEDTSNPKNDRLCQLPPGRVKTIIKSDPDVPVVSAECTFLISKSCELFLQWLGKKVYPYTVQQKRKTLKKTDLDMAINEHPALEFLDGALD